MYLAQLKKQIKEKKNELFFLYREQGVSSEVLKLSEELDMMIYEYQLLKSPLLLKSKNVQD